MGAHFSAEIYQLICEGISNIHRPTQCKEASIHLHQQTNSLALDIINVNNMQKPIAALHLYKRCHCQ